MFDTAFNGRISLEEGMEYYIENFVYEEDRKMMRQESSGENLKEKLAEQGIRAVQKKALVEGFAVFCQKLYIAHYM